LRPANALQKAQKAGAVGPQKVVGWDEGRE